MKKLFWTLAFFFPALLFAQSKVNWISLEEAVAAQKKEPRKIIIDVYTSWCGPCKMMEKNTFSNADVISYVNENYYAVKFNAESPEPVTFKGQTFTNPSYKPDVQGRNGVHELSQTFGVHAYPTIVYLDENLELLAPVSGYRTPQQLELFLKFFDGDHHLTVTTQDQWTAWQEAFSPTFR